MIKLLNFVSLGTKLVILKILNASLLGVLFGFLFQYSITLIETENLFVFAYQKNSVQDILINTPVNDSTYLKGYLIIGEFQLFVDIALT